MRAQVAACLVSCASRADGGVSASFRFAADLPVFAGHFPGRPLVPGVFLIEAARLACERATGAPLRVSRVVKAKFLAEVGPDSAVDLEAELSEDDDVGLTLRAALRTVGDGGKTNAASLRLVLAKEGA